MPNISYVTNVDKINFQNAKMLRVGLFLKQSCESCQWSQFRSYFRGNLENINQDVDKIAEGEM